MSGKGLLKTTEGVTGNLTMKVLAVVVDPTMMPDGALVTADIIAASVEGTLEATVVTGIADASNRALVLRWQQ